jgi:hypothetical protein
VPTSRTVKHYNDLNFCCQVKLESICESKIRHQDSCVGLVNALAWLGFVSREAEERNFASGKSVDEKTFG